MMELYKALAPLGLPIAFIGFILILGYICLMPEKAEKVAKWIWFVGSFFSNYAKRKSTQFNLQTKVNSITKGMEKHLPDDFKRSILKIEFLPEEMGEQELKEIKKNVLILRVHDKKEEKKNLVNTTMVFITKAFIPRGETFMSKWQKRTTDIFVGHKFFLELDKSTADVFYEEHVSPNWNSDRKFQDLITKFEIIDKCGLFFPIFISEMQFIGEEYINQFNKKHVYEEIALFINHLEKVSKRVVGEEMDMNFNGRYLKTAIVIPAKKRNYGKTSTFINHIRKLVNHGYVSIYILGKEDYTDFLNDIVTACLQTFPRFQCVFKKKFKQIIKVPGKKELKTKAYMALLRDLSTRNRFNNASGIEFSNDEDYYPEDE